MLAKIEIIIRSKALNADSVICKLLKNIGIGRLVFHLRCLLYTFENKVLKRFNQRFLEYSFVLTKLRNGESRLLLDVGCSGTLLDHELLARGFRVIGLDINDHALRNYREKFMKANIIKNNLPSEIFDVIVVISTIEHIGLDTYSQDILTQNGDLLAMKEFRRLLKPDGVLILTTNYEGKGPMRIHVWGRNGELKERRYDSNRLSKLLEGFKIIDSAFFLCLLRHGCRFIRIPKNILDKFPAEKCEGSLACLYIKKVKS